MLLRATAHARKNTLLILAPFFVRQFLPLIRPSYLVAPPQPPARVFFASLWPQLGYGPSIAQSRRRPAPSPARVLRQPGPASFRAGLSHHGGTRFSRLPPFGGRHEACGRPRFRGRPGGRRGDHGRLHLSHRDRRRGGRRAGQQHQRTRELLCSKWWRARST